MKKSKLEIFMKRNNSEILNKVRSVVNEKNQKLTKPTSTNLDRKTDGREKEINKWIEDNAEKIAKEIIKEEVKKLFK
jgi:serine protease inhibitor